MSLSCACGSHDSFVFAGGVDVCRACGQRRSVTRLPLLVVTGGAASGKSSVCRRMESDPRVLALDVEVVGRGAAAVAEGRGNYDAFWGYLLRLGLEFQLNGLAPIFCGFCRPAQILANPEVERFAGLHVLALVCDEPQMTQRILGRFGGQVPPDRLEVHHELDRELRILRLDMPHSVTLLDTSILTVDETLIRAAQWVEAVLQRQALGATA